MDKISRVYKSGRPSLNLVDDYWIDVEAVASLASVGGPVSST